MTDSPGVVGGGIALDRDARSAVHPDGDRAGYGDTLTWSDTDKPNRDLQPVEIQVDLDKERFYKMFVDLLKAETPRP